MSDTAEPVVIPAYVDEAGARGLLRDLTPARDHEAGILVALAFEPEAHAKAVAAFTPGFERFRATKPPGAKLHITDAFARGNEAWRPVAEEVREEFLNLIMQTNPMVIYAARRLRLSRLAYERDEQMAAQGRANRRSKIKIDGENRPSDDRVEDELMVSLALRLDAFAEWATDLMPVKQVDLLFDQNDGATARRYEAQIQRTRDVGRSTHKVAAGTRTKKRRSSAPTQSALKRLFASTPSSSAIST
ncbi:MAG: hypothetical protein H7124_07970 [Phycisphaerales bacterium]|nr:hypothetical protein [Hyphomonadaceae bacterium]